MAHENDWSRASSNRWTRAARKNESSTGSSQQFFFLNVLGVFKFHNLCPWINFNDFFRLTATIPKTWICICDFLCQRRKTTKKVVWQHVTVDGWGEKTSTEKCKVGHVWLQRFLDMYARFNVTFPHFFSSVMKTVIVSLTIFSLIFFGKWTAVA